MAKTLRYREALREMLAADGLLVMQGSNCNEQIPAKLYEYFRARRPILGLADPKGDTGTVMREAGVQHVAQLENAEHVERALSAYLAESRPGAAQMPMAPPLMAMSRRARARTFAALLDEVRSAGSRVQAEHSQARANL